MYENPLISRVHNEFRNIRYELSTFFANYDRELIRFQFGETPTQFQFRVKFASSHRSLRFCVNKTSHDKIVVEKLEKTTDIVTDIDEINKVIEEPMELYWLSQDFQCKLQSLFLWGVQKNKDRKRENYRAAAERLPDWSNDNIVNMSKEILYFDIITSYEVVSQKDIDGFIEVKLNLLWSEPYYITCQDYYLENIRPGRLLIVNWLQRYNVMNFASAKHHLNFNSSDYHAINIYLVTHGEQTTESDNYRQRKKDEQETTGHLRSFKRESFKIRNARHYKH